MTRAVKNKCPLICGPRSLPDRLSRMEESGYQRGQLHLGQRSHKKFKDVDNRQTQETNSMQHEETEIKRCYGGEENEEKTDPQKDETIKPQTSRDSEDTKPCQMLLKINKGNRKKDEKMWEEEDDKCKKYSKNEQKRNQELKKDAPEVDNRFIESFRTENLGNASFDKRSQNQKSDVQEEQMRVGKASLQKDEIPERSVTEGLQNILDESSAPSTCNMQSELNLGLHVEAEIGYGISELNFLDPCSPVNQTWNIGGQGKNLEKHLSNIFISLKQQMDAQEGIDEKTVSNTLKNLMDKLQVKLSKDQFLKVMNAIGADQWSRGLLECFNLLSTGSDLDWCKVDEKDGALNQQKKMDPTTIETSNQVTDAECHSEDGEPEAEENGKEVTILEEKENGTSAPANEEFEGDSGHGIKCLDEAQDGDETDDEIDKSLEENMEKTLIAVGECSHDSRVCNPAARTELEEDSDQGLVDEHQVEEEPGQGTLVADAGSHASGCSISGLSDERREELYADESDEGLFDQPGDEKPEPKVARSVAEDMKQNSVQGNHEEILGNTMSLECLTKQFVKRGEMFHRQRQKCLDDRKATVKTLKQGQVWKRMKGKIKLASERTSSNFISFIRNSSVFEKDPGYEVEVLTSKVAIGAFSFRTKSCMSSAGNKGGNSSMGGKGGNSPTGGRGDNSRRNSRDNDDSGSQEGNSNSDEGNGGDGGESLPVKNLPTAALVNCNIPGQDFKSVRKKHSNITDDELIYLLGSLSLDTGPDIQESPGLLGEVDHCLRILLHSLPNHTDPDCSICSLIHSLISHFANCTRLYRQCQVCWQTLQLALHHVHSCIQEGSRSKESQNDVCYQLIKAADRRADVVKDKRERLWTKMKKCVVKVFQPVGLHGSGSLGMYSLLENEEANYPGLTTSSMASSDQSGLSAMGSGTAQLARSAAASSTNGQFQRTGSGRFQPSLRSIPESPRRNGSLPQVLRRPRKISRQVSNESNRSALGSKSDDTSLPESQKADVAEASLGEFHEVFLSLPITTAEPSSNRSSSLGQLDDISVTTSLSSTSGQNEEGQTAEDIIYQRYKPMMEGNGNIFPESRSARGYNQDPYETQKTYGMVGVVSLPIRPNIQREREQLLSLELRPTGEPGIGEVVYGTRRQIMKVAQYWARIRGNMDNESYKHQVREEGVILDSAKRSLRILRTRYQKKNQWLRLVHLGNGVAGKCHLARDVTSGFKFCVKRVHIAKYEENELMTWSDLDHANIVKLYGAIRHGNKIYIFCEFIAGGSLTSLINEQRSLNRRLSHWMCVRYFKQLLQVLTYLKSKNILHEDLKADNILIRQSSTLIAVADFGLARSMNVDSEMKGMSPIGSQTQWSPEKATSMGHGFAADVWAAVCILVHMLSGHPPWTQRYPGLQMLHFVIFTQSPPLADIPANIQEVMRDLITQGFTVDPTLRPSAAQLLDHQAFKILDQGPPDTYYSTLVNSGQVIPNNLIDNSVKGPQELDSILNSLDTRRPASGDTPQERPSEASESVVYTRQFATEGSMRIDDGRDKEISYRKDSDREVGDGNNSASGFANQDSKIDVVSPGTSEEDSRSSITSKQFGSGPRQEGSGSFGNVVSPGTSEEDPRTSINSRLFGSGQNSTSSLRRSDGSTRPGDQDSSSSMNSRLFGSGQNSSSSLRRSDGSTRPGDQSSASSTNKSPGTDTREGEQPFRLEHNRVISDEGSSSAGPIVLSSGSLPLPPDGSGAVGDRSSDFEGNQPNWSNLQVSMRESAEGQDSSFDDPDDHISRYLQDDLSVPQRVKTAYPRLTEYCPPPKEMKTQYSDNVPKWSILLENLSFSGIILDPTESYQENSNPEEKRNPEVGTRHFDVPDKAAGSVEVVKFSQNDMDIKRQALQSKPFSRESSEVTTVQSPFEKMDSAVKSQTDISRQASQAKEQNSGKSSPLHKISSSTFHLGGSSPGNQDPDQSPAIGANSPKKSFSGESSGHGQRKPHNSGNSSRESSIGQTSGQRRPHNSGNSSRESSIGQASGHSSPTLSRSGTAGQGYVSPSQNSPLRTEYIELPIRNQATPVKTRVEDPYPTSYYPPTNLFDPVNSDELFGDPLDPQSYTNFGQHGQASSTPVIRNSSFQISPRYINNHGQLHQSQAAGESKDLRYEVNIKPEPLGEAAVFPGPTQKVSKVEAQMVQNHGFMFQNERSSTPKASLAKQRSASTNGSTLKGGTADYAYEPKVKDSGSLENLLTEQEVEKSPKKNKNLTLDVNRTVPKSSNYHRVVSEPANSEKPVMTMSHPKTCPEICMHCTRDSSGIGTSLQYVETTNNSRRSSDPPGITTPDRSRHISAETTPSTPKSQYEQQEKEFSALSQSDVESSHELAMADTFEEEDVRFTLGPGSFKEELESVQKTILDDHSDLGHKYQLLKYDHSPLRSILVLPRYKEWIEIVDIIRTAVKQLEGLDHFTLRMSDDQLVDYNAPLTHGHLRIRVCPVSEEEVKTGQTTCWCEEHDLHFH